MLAVVSKIEPPHQAVIEACDTEARHLTDVKRRTLGTQWLDKESINASPCGEKDYHDNSKKSGSSPKGLQK